MVRPAEGERVYVVELQEPLAVAPTAVTIDEGAASAIPCEHASAYRRWNVATAGWRGFRCRGPGVAVFRFLGRFRLGRPTFFRLVALPCSGMLPRTAFAPHTALAPRLMVPRRGLFAIRVWSAESLPARPLGEGIESQGENRGHITVGNAVAEQSPRLFEPVQKCVVDGDVEAMEGGDGNGAAGSGRGGSGGCACEGSRGNGCTSDRARVG